MNRISYPNLGEVLVEPIKAIKNNLIDGGRYYLDITPPKADEMNVEYLDRLCKTLPALRKWKVEMANQTEISNGLLRIFFVLHQISE